MNSEKKKKPEIPLGFGMALAQNMKAMKVFANFSESEQQKCIDRAHTIDSKDEMQHFVDDIAKTEF